MATATENSMPSQNQDLENPNKTLTLNTSNLIDTSNDTSTTSHQIAAEASIEGVDVNKEAEDDSKDTENQDVNKEAVVSPTGGGVDIEKKVRRAERFGVPVQLSEQEKRNSRAERFGIGAGSESSKLCEDQKAAEDLKRKARAERFGITVPTDEDAKKKARVARFGSDTKSDKKADPVEEEKRKARAQRFAQPPSNAVPHISEKEALDSNTAVASNGVGGA